MSDDAGEVRPIFDIHEDPDLGRRIGPYRLTRELGQGGMGTIYLAERVEGIERRAAIKILDRRFARGEMLERFQNECQILADLDHPSIARLYDSGTLDDGRPFLAMEYVSGRTITEHSVEHGLSIDECIALVLEICAAVEHAHQHFIVHRDLKPGNILVDEDGRVKLLDFGIAKILQQESAHHSIHTSDGFGLMTLRYAAPEQIRGEAITPKTDVYGLGGLLYELLASRPPFEEGASMAEFVERVCREEPLPPSLNRDLDAVVLKALRKDPQERCTLGALTADLRRYLDGLPVSARDAGRTERAGRFARRHRGFVAGAAAVFIALLIYGTTTTVLLRRAEAERLRATEVATFLLDVVSAGNPEQTRAKFEQIEKRLPTLEHLPELHDDLLDAIVRYYYQTGDFAAGVRVLEDAIDRVGEKSSAIGKWYANLASFLVEDPEAQADAYRSALDLRRRRGETGASLFKAMNNLAHVLLRLNETEEARRLYMEVLEGRSSSSEPSAGLASSYRHLARLELSIGRLSRAEERAEEALKMRRRIYAEHGDEHQAIASALNLLGRIRVRCGQAEQGEALLRESLEIRRRVLGPGHRFTASSELHLAEALKKHDACEADRLIRRALPIWEISPGVEVAEVAAFRERLRLQISCESSSVGS